MAHMKLKKISKKTKLKSIFIIIFIYIIFSYTFYNSFKNNDKISNEQFITFLLNNGNSNFTNEYKIPEVINKTMTYFLKIDITFFNLSISHITSTLSSSTISNLLVSPI